MTGEKVVLGGQGSDIFLGPFQDGITLHGGVGDDKFTGALEGKSTIDADKGNDEATLFVLPGAEATIRGVEKIKVVPIYKLQSGEIPTPDDIMAGAKDTTPSLTIGKDSSGAIPDIVFAGDPNSQRVKITYAL